MRSARLFRNEKFALALRPFWDSCRSRNFARNCLACKKAQVLEPDPYEGNYSFLECDQYTKVTVIGAAGRVGQTLSLLLKTCPLIDHLCLFDTNKAVKGIGLDISHIDTKCCVSYVCGMRNIQQALDRPDVVVIAAGYPVSPDLQGRKLFDKNAPIVAGLSEACARFCPKACIVVITNPINSLLPVVAEVFQTITNRKPARKLFGFTTLDVVRANTFAAEVIRKDPNSIIVPVIGGTSQETIVPVLSQMKPFYKIKHGEMLALTECIRRAEGNLTDCQNCGTRGSSSLSTAYAAFRFTTALVMALKGAEDIVECAYVKSDVIPELEYLASPLKLGVRGIEHNYGYPPLSEYELAELKRAAASLITDINLGKSFVRSIEETIREGVVWKRLTEETSKGERRQSAAVRKAFAGKGKERKGTERKSGEEAGNTVIEKGVIYTHSGDWAAPAKNSLKRLLHPEETPQEEMTTDSISAEVEGCRSDQSLHEETSIGGINPSDPVRSLSAGDLLRPRRFDAQSVRSFHSNNRLEDQNRTTQNSYHQYIHEERKRTSDRMKSPVKLESAKHKAKSPSEAMTQWEDKFMQRKGLNVMAKQKMRNYNNRKRLSPSASVLLMFERKTQDEINKDFFRSIREKSERKYNEYKRKVREKQLNTEFAREEFMDAEVDAEQEENSSERQVLEQIQKLKKENELLRERISALSKESRDSTQNDSLELEKTKLKACWLLMASTIDAFGAFCKRFTTKGDRKSAEKTGDGESDDVFEDALEEIPQDESKYHDDKYLKFLQKLMEDQMASSSKLRKTA